MVADERSSCCYLPFWTAPDPVFWTTCICMQTPLDIVIAMVIGSNLSRALTGNAPFVLTATAVIVVVFWVIEHFSASSQFIGFLVKGRPVELMQDGRLLETTMWRAGVTRADISESARQSGIADLDQIHAAILELNGKISVLKGQPLRSAEAVDLIDSVSRHKTDRNDAWGIAR
jgi:uncharacterized membrane protein YcaP (DUF421 family)